MKAINNLLGRNSGGNKPQGDKDTLAYNQGGVSFEEEVMIIDPNAQLQEQLAARQSPNRNSSNSSPRQVRQQGQEGSGFKPRHSKGQEVMETPPRLQQNTLVSKQLSVAWATTCMTQK
jgi:hypothetical protein